MATLTVLIVKILFIGLQMRREVTILLLNAFYEFVRNTQREATAASGSKEYLYKTILGMDWFGGEEVLAFSD